ncbi:2OG-Fe(II) oxygenase [Gallaecimonas sp. GXIMD4217]|uniref:2OG-Fe(II) oxygenase n=1 Tax=Gallaecimonas sp. GXIMD4217 TaxID=3131927 RepID=UPI00311AF063
MTAVPPSYFDSLKERICDDLVARGYSIQPGALAEPLRQALRAELLDRAEEMSRAGIGRGGDRQLAREVRSDSTLWLDGSSPAQERYLALMGELRLHLNRGLYLGLNDFEGHFAHYGPGHFYQKHRDAFRGQSNRLVSAVTYLNDYWPQGAGGELVLYDETGEERELARISPEPGTLVVFLSEGFPHEVLTAGDDRYSIAGWFRRDGGPL